MGWVKRQQRKLTGREQDLLDRLVREAKNEQYAVARGSATALEFDIGIDRIVKYPYEGLSEHAQLYVLEIKPKVLIGFECCFMNFAMVEGRFPSDRVRIAFAVHSRANGLCEDFAPACWPISFHWYGGPIDVIECSERPPIDEVLEVYRFKALNEAFERYTTTYGRLRGEFGDSG